VKNQARIVVRKFVVEDVPIEAAGGLLETMAGSISAQSLEL
jgi:hypothetical protein